MLLAKVFKLARSHVVALPRPVLRSLDVERGDYLIIEQRRSGEIILRKLEVTPRATSH